MDYEKKYSEALERAKECHVDGLALHQPVKDVLEYIFPELQESEDERILEIIKHCIESRYLHTSTIKGISQKQCFTWLEKQGEQEKPQVYETKDGEVITYSESEGYKVVKPKFKVGDIIIKSQNSDINKFGKFKITGIKDGRYWYNEFVICEISEQDEWELIPKFNVGNWITNGQLTCKVLSVTGKSYELHLYNDDYCHFETDIQSVDKDYHLWSIKDSKDGDVLAEDTCTFIIKKLNHDLTAEIYCCLYDDGDFEFNSNLGFDDTCTYPATKEQHDLLFQKMKEEGYKWDAEKKELKKISQRMISAEAKEAMYDKPTDNDIVEALRTEYEKGRADAIAEMEKPTWSDEDVYNSKLILSTINQDQDLSLKTKDKLTSWIKSIKQRIGI